MTVFFDNQLVGDAENVNGYAEFRVGVGHYMYNPAVSRW
jgi:hypothetical protein